MRIEDLSEYACVRETYGVAFDTHNLISHSLRFWMLALSSRVIWPEFTEYRNMILLSDNFDADTVDDWIASVGDPTSIEFV